MSKRALQRCNVESSALGTDHCMYFWMREMPIAAGHVIQRRAAYPHTRIPPELRIHKNSTEVRIILNNSNNSWWGAAGAAEKTLAFQTKAGS